MPSLATIRKVISKRFFGNLLPIPATNPFGLGAIAPPFDLLNVTDGERVKLLNYVGTRPSDPPREKQPVLLCFSRIFAEKVYCPLCYPHIVALNKQYEQFTQRGVAVMLIVSTDPQQTKTVVQDLALKLPVLSDPTCRIFRLYRVGQALGAPLPAQFLIDLQGRIRFRHLFSFLEPNASVERLLVACDRITSPAEPPPLLAGDDGDSSTATPPPAETPA
ncbi:MAG: peroxiredoxin family protein [Cyanobacteria bacterium J06638_20]